MKAVKVPTRGDERRVASLLIDRTCRNSYLDLYTDGGNGFHRRQTQTIECLRKCSQVAARALRVRVPNVATA